MTRPISISALSMLMLFSGPAWSVPVQWSLASGGNDHWYEYISLRITWAAARTGAQSQGGYLATITSVGEQEFVFANFPELAWIGGSDQAEEGVWKWMDGPEAGTTFWDNGVTTTYSFWNTETFEPNNETALGEDYLQFAFNGLNGEWNDDGGPGHPNQSNGYIVEYSANVVPVPMSAWLFGSALGVMGWLRRKTSG